MSLLTQFYNCDGGGGGGGGSAAVGMPAIYTLGQSVTPSNSPGQATPFSSGFTTTANGAFSFSWNPSGGAYTGLVINNAVLSYNLSLDPGLETITLNGGVLTTSLFAPSLPNLSSISGSGIIQYISNSSGGPAGPMPSLTTISTDIRFIPTISFGDYVLIGAALNATSVNHILTSLVDNGGVAVGSGIVNLSGGTSAGNGALTAAGSAALAALTGAGWIITLNP